MARTMTDERERDIRLFCANADTRFMGIALLAELDAERAAHQETKAKVGRLMVALHGDGSSIPGAEDELAALKSRLVLAEAVCRSCDLDGYDRAALDAWSEAQGRDAK